MEEFQMIVSSNVNLVSGIDDASLSSGGLLGSLLIGKSSNQQQIPFDLSSRFDCQLDTQSVTLLKINSPEENVYLEAVDLPYSANIWNCKDILTGNNKDIPLVQSNIDTSNFDESRLTSLQSTLAEAIASVSAQLQKFIVDPLFSAKLQTAFGTNWAVEAGKALVTRLVNSESLLSAGVKLEILPVPRSQIRGAFFAQTSTIYLSEDFLNQNAEHPDGVAAVLIEELGHYIDAQLNQSDSPGDEGAIFAALVQSQALNEQDLANLKAEDDFAQLTVNQQSILVECATVNDAFASAMTLSGSSGSVSSNNVGATGEIGEPAQSGAIKSVWWKWTALRNGDLTIDTKGSALDNANSNLKCIIV